MSDELRPWDRRKGESVQAYQAFKHYLELGEKRSLQQVAFDVGKSPNLMTTWSRTNDWVARCVAYDGHMGGLELARKEKVRAEYAERAERRRMETAESTWDLGTRLFERAQEMLNFPISTREITQEAYDDGRIKHMVIINPAKWDMKTAALFARAAADLCQVAMIQMNFAQDSFDPTRATPDELRAYLASHGVNQLPAPGSGDQEA